MLEITELRQDAAYAVTATLPMTPEEIETLSKDFERAGAKPIFLDPGMTVEPLDREQVYAFRIPGISLQPYQIEAFRKSLEEGPRIKGVFLDNHVEMSALTFDDYDHFTRKTAKYPELGDTFVYPTLGALGEGSEVFEKIYKFEVHLGRLGEHVKKLWRDFGVTNQTRFDGLAATLGEKKFAELIALRNGVIKELGDAQWYLTAIAREFHTTIGEVAKASIEKLAGRLERDTIGGSGDNR